MSEMDPQTREATERFVLLEKTLRARRESDPLVAFKPHPKQQAFIDAVLDSTGTPENWFLAANRSGKSDAGCYCVAQIARHGFKGEPFRPTSGWVSSLDFPSSRDIIQPKLFDNGLGVSRTHEPFIPDREIAEWRVSDQLLILKNKSVIGFKSADSGRKKYQGTDKDYVLLDEEHEEGIYEETIMRIPAGVQLRIFGTCTLLPPEGTGGGVSWIFPKKVQPWQAGGAPWGIFGASIYDNASLDIGAIRYLEAIYPEGSIQRRIRLNGELLPGLSGARCYAAFQRQLHVKPLGDINPRLPIAWFWDFNVEPMMSGICQYDGDVFRIFKILSMEEGNTMGMCDLFKEHYPRHGAELIVYGDASGNSRTSKTGDTDYQLIRNAFRTYPVPLRMKVPLMNPGIKDRINSVNYALKNEFGELSVEVNNRDCHELIDDFEQVIYDKNGLIRKTNDSSQIYFRRTHITDALGYLIWQEAPIRLIDAPKKPKYGVQRIAQPGYGFSKR